MREKLLLLHITSDIHLLSSFNCYIGIRYYGSDSSGRCKCTRVPVLNFVSIVFYLSLLLLILLRSKNHLTINRFLSI